MTLKVLDFFTLVTWSWLGFKTTFLDTMFVFPLPSGSTSMQAVLPGLSCGSFSVTLIKGHGNLKRHPEGSFVIQNTCQLKIKMYIMSCELRFLGGKIRTIAREREFQIVLRNCSKEVGWEVSEGGVCAIKPMFFLQKVDRGIYSSVIELLLFTRLMAYYQNIFSVFL